MAGRSETKQYWIDQLSEYWDSGLTIQEYCELKEVSYESARRWIALLKKERDGKGTEGGALELVEVSMPRLGSSQSGTGVNVLANGLEVQVDKNFDQETLIQVLTVLRALPCSASAGQ